MTDWKYCQLFQAQEGLFMLVDNGKGKWEVGHKVTTIIDGDDLIVKEGEISGQGNQAEGSGTDKVS